MLSISAATAQHRPLRRSAINGKCGDDYLNEGELKFGDEPANGTGYFKCVILDGAGVSRWATTVRDPQAPSPQHPSSFQSKMVHLDWNSGYTAIAGMQPLPAELFRTDILLCF